jgi:drug/metabolite transporter (DMT)-like permease
MKSMKPGILALLGAVTIWGSTFVITKFLLSDIGPFMVIGLRLTISLLVITPFAMRHGFHWKMIVEKRFLLFGLTGIALYFGLSNTGLDRSTAANAALIQAANPAAVALLSVMFLQEKITWQRAMGIGLSILGVLLISGIPSTDGQSTLVGNLLIVGSVIAWAIYTVQGKKLTGNTDPLAATTASFYTGLIWLAPFIFLELRQSGFPFISPLSWLAIAYLGIFASALAYFLWNDALRSVDASIAGPFINLIPIIGLIFSILVGERIFTIQIIGGLIAITGVFFTQNILNFSKGKANENPGPSD